MHLSSFFVLRRRRTHFSDKDIDCDIRENIINYEDEGGGEGDQTGYDLSVLRMLENGGSMLPLEKLPSSLPPPVPAVPGGVKDFLDENKDRADMDPEGNPYDDLRHYAYEGDGEWFFLFRFLLVQQVPYSFKKVFFRSCLYKDLNFYWPFSLFLFPSVHLFPFPIFSF